LTNGSTPLSTVQFQVASQVGIDLSFAVSATSVAQ
jgi:hypothetical protein